MQQKRPVDEPDDLVARMLEKVSKTDLLRLRPDARIEAVVDSLLVASLLWVLKGASHLSKWDLASRAILTGLLATALKVAASIPWRARWSARRRSSGRRT